MEQNEAMNMPTYDSVRRKSGAGGKIIVVLAFLLAIGGIGFGVYSMMQCSEKDNKIADLENQVKNASESAASSSSSSTDIEVPKGYIYLNEWGLKVKIDSTIRPLKVAYGIGSDGEEYVSISAIFNEDFPEYKDISIYPQGRTIFRSKLEKMEFTGMGEISPVYSDSDDYNYFVVGPTGVGPENGISDELMGKLIKANDQLGENLNTTANYSKM